MKNWFKICLLIIFLGVVMGYFYWYELRPAKIREKCNDSAFQGSMDSFDIESYTQSGRMDLKEKFYRDCLRYEGIKE